ncbi:MAG: CotH kinase family protein [Bacteroidaceae bacterium]|nr:CotH kinase family protein [Bacteroidaceae bacterium]
MRKLLTLICFVICVVTNAQEWTDFTDVLFTNAKFENGSTDGWYVSSKPKEKTDGAVGFSAGGEFDMYQLVTALPKGKYRMTIYGYYRDGSAASDYNKSKNTSYKGNSKAIYNFYAGNMRQIQIPCASSGVTDEKLSDDDVMVAEGKYVPGSVKGAKARFDKGLYAMTVVFTVTNEYMYIEPILQTYDSNGFFVFGGIKLEFQGTLTKHESIVFDKSDFTVAEGKYAYNYFTYFPENVSIKKYLWTSSNPDVAIVYSDGNVYGVAEGEADITMTAMDGSGVSATYHVVVEGNIDASNENIELSEVCVSDLDMNLDASYNYGSWIELYNKSNKFVNLNGLYVTDDKANLKKAKIVGAGTDKSNIVSPNSFICVEFDHYDPVFSPTMIDFKLKYEGGTIYVTDGEQVIDSVAYPQSIARTSYVRTLGTDEWRMCALPSKNRAWGEGLEYLYGSEQAEAPTFSEPGGFFTGTKDVTIHVPEGSWVIYTLDGTTPTIMHGKAIQTDSVFSLKETAVFRAITQKDGYLNSDVVTRSYIKKDKRYVFPVINIVTDQANMTSSERGIFVEGYNGRPGNGRGYACNWNMDWERPVNFEYITADGEYALSQEVDMSACGGWSRAWTPHSFKLKANKYYMGLKTMDYPFFTAKPNIRHKALQIRNGGNDVLTQCKFIDPSIQEIVRRSGMAVNTQCWQPVHVFFNGKYQYLLNMREPNNKHYAYSNYGYDTDEIDQFEMSPDSGYVQKEGSSDAYNHWYDISANAADPVVFKEICDLVDMDEFINYMAVELFLANKDWPQNNVKAFRSVHDGKFHFVLFDLDQTNQVTENPFTAFEKKRIYEFNPLLGDYRTPWESGDQITQEIKLVTIFLNMLNNDKFRRQFIDTYCVVAGSVFSTNYAKPILDEMRKTMNSGLTLDGLSCDNSYSLVKGFFTTDKNNNRFTQLKAYSKMKISKERTAVLSVNIPEARLFLNDVEIPYAFYSGKVFDDVTITTSAPEGYKFLGWSMFKGGEILYTDLSVELTKASYRLVANWVKMDENDFIASGQQRKPVVVNEISASNDIFVSDYFKKSDWIELYNPTDSAVNIAGLYITDNLTKAKKYQVPVDDARLNTIIPAHGFKVIWCDKKDNIGTDIHTNFKLEGEEGVVMIAMYGDDDVEYADTLTYSQHDGIQSYGLFPDAGLSSITMNKPTPGSANICGSDILQYMAPERFYTGINDVVTSSSDSGITIAYVGGGVVNVQSNADLSRLNVYSVSGSPVCAEQLHGTFATVSLPTLPAGIYVLKAVDAQGNVASHKIIIR